MKRPTPSRLFLYALAAILCLPGIAMLVLPHQLAAINEKRVLVPFPDVVPRLARLDRALGADLNRWFDDHYGFRDLLIRAKNQIDYSLFGTSLKVAIGKDRWLFLRDNSQALVNYEIEGDPWRADVERKLLAIAAYLNARGIRFIVLAVPDKSQMYGDMAPGDLPLPPTPTQFDRLRSDLMARPELTYIDARDVLKTDDAGRNLYWKTDIHYTFDTARQLVRALVETVARLDSRPPPAPPRDFVEFPYPIHGDIANFMPMLQKIVENTFAYSNGYIVDRDTNEGVWQKDADRVDVPGIGLMPFFDFIYRTRSEHTEGKLPVTVLFGNSFSDMYFAVGLQTYFTDFYRARNVADRFDLSLQHLPPGTKYVVYQYFAPFIETDLHNDRLLTLPAPR